MVASQEILGRPYMDISFMLYIIAIKIVLCVPKSFSPFIIRKTKNSSFKNEKSKKEVDVTITVSNKDIV